MRRVLSHPLTRQIALAGVKALATAIAVKAKSETTKEIALAVSAIVSAPQFLRTGNWCDN